MSRRAKQLIAMVIVYVISIAFAYWALKQPAGSIPAVLALPVSAIGFLVMVVPQLYWLHIETRETEDKIHRRIWYEGP